MSESVAGRLAAPHWLPNTPPLTAWPDGEWADSTGKRTDLKTRTIAVDPCSRVRGTPPRPQSRKQGKGTAFGDQRIVALVFAPQTTITTNVGL